MFTGLLASGVLVTDDSDVQAHWTKMNGTDLSVYYAVETLIKGLKSANLWNKIDTLCVAHETAEDSLLDLKDGTSCTTNGSISFTDKLGYTIAPSTFGAYISFGKTEFGTYSVHDSHCMLYMQDDSTSKNRYALSLSRDGLAASSGIFLYQSLGAPSTSYIGLKVQYESNTVPAALQKFTGSVPKGFIYQGCSSSNYRHVRLNATFEASAEVNDHTADLESTYTMRVGADMFGNSSCPGTYSAWSVGDYMTLSESSAYRTLIEAYMVAIGADA